MRIASIISDPKRRREWSYRIISLRRKLSLLLYGGGIIWLLLLPTDVISGRIYTDENALLPGTVAREYNGDQKVLQLAEQLDQVAWGELPYWTSSKFSSFEMEVFTQNFSISLPVMQSTGITEGVNVYAVKRAAKTSSSEAIVVAVMVDKDSRFSLAMLVSLAEYLSTKVIWAKDLIFVVTNGGKYGIQAWVESYLGIESESIIKSPVVSRSGIIQAAIIIDITSPAIKHVSLLTNGINGQLSNQDIANTAVRLLMQERIPPSFHGQVDVPYQDRYYGGLKTMLRGIGHQATGLPEHLHGLFVRYHIDAVTFLAYHNPISTKNRQLLAFGRAIEGTLRSINNLLEPLHHSFFFYLPVSSYRYVSISIYFPPLGCLFIALVVEGLSQWLLARDPQLRAAPVEPAVPTANANNVYVPIPLGSLLPIGLTTAACGYFVYISPVVYSNLIGPLTPTALLYCIIATVAVSMVMVPFIRLVSCADWHMVKFFCILLLLLLLLAISLLNFSLSLMLTVGLTLPCLFAAPISSSGLDRHCVVRILFTLLLSPSLIFLYYVMLYVYMFKGHDDLTAVFSQSVDLVTEGLTELYLSSHVLGSWVYVTVLTCVWPVWLAIWSINFQ